MDDDATTLISFRGGAIERAAWDRLWDAADGACARRALGSRRERYRRRVQEEMAAFAQLGLEPGVLLEVSWLVGDLRGRGVTFGPGYGPQSGSLLLHLLGLNGVDPLDHGLPFLGFGRELEARRLHLRVASRAEQAELAAALRKWGQADPRFANDERTLEVVIGRDPGLALTREMARMAEQASGGHSCDPLHWVYPWDDPETLRLIARGETEGIPQLDGEQLREALRAAAPRTLDEVIQVVVATRDAGPHGLRDRYLAARSGVERPALPHPELEEVLASTANVWLFREQVVIAVARLAGCSSEQAVRSVQRLSEEGSEAREGSYSQQLAERVAERCSVPYARGLYLVRSLRQSLAQVVDRSAVLAEVTEAYRQAYYKARYPAAFQAARMNACLAQVSPRHGLRYMARGGVSARCPHREAVIALCREAVRDGLTVLPPDVNRSRWGFQAEDRNSLRFGLGLIAGIDRSAAERLAARRRGSDYRSLMDLVVRGFDGAARIDQIEPLIFSGALGDFGRDRWALRRELDQVRQPRRAWQNAYASSRGAGSDGFPELRGPEGWHGESSAEGWGFQRELDVLGCVPSRQYFPEPAAESERLRPVR